MDSELFKTICQAELQNGEVMSDQKFRQAFETAVETVREEGRYRIFRDIRRKAGAFPRATWFKDDQTEQDITVWCSNDYLGMGQNPCVVEAVKAVSYTHLTLPTKA